MKLRDVGSDTSVNDSVQGDHQWQLLHANKAFLREEIDPLTFLEAFSKRGLDHFKEANIEIQRMKLRDVGSDTSVNDSVQTNKNDK
jgi:hypothetical protein